MLTQVTVSPDNHFTLSWKFSGRSFQKKNEDPEDNSKVIWTHCRFGLAEKPQPSPCWLRLAIHWTSDFQDDMSVSSSSSHNTSKKFRANGRKPLIQIWTRPASSSRHYPEQQLTDLPPIDFPLTMLWHLKRQVTFLYISLSHHLHRYVSAPCQLTINTSSIPTTRFAWTFQSLPSVAQPQAWHRHLWQGQIQSTRLRELKRLQSGKKTKTNGNIQIEPLIKFTMEDNMMMTTMIQVPEALIDQAKADPDLPLSTTRTPT